MNFVFLLVYHLSVKSVYLWMKTKLKVSQNRMNMQMNTKLKENAREFLLEKYHSLI